MSADFGQLLQARLGGFCKLRADVIAKLEAHYQLLVRWNRVMNLTSVRGIHGIVERHYCESLFLGCQLPSGPAHVADVGSGAGFPGVPIAILRPELTVTLIESHQRKAVFLLEATRAIGNVRVRAVRVELLDELFDWTVSRGVRYEDVAGTLARLAPRAVLLTGAAVKGDLPEFEWTRVVPLPWGDRRFLRIGRARPLEDCFT